MRRTSARAWRALAILLVLSPAIFGAGAWIERGSHATETQGSTQELPGHVDPTTAPSTGASPAAEAGGENGGGEPGSGDELPASATLAVRGSGDEHPGPEATAAREPAGGVAVPTASPGPAMAAASTGGDEGFFGIDPEAAWLIVAAVVATLVLAAGALVWRRRILALAILLFAGAFALMDVREVLHQIGEGRTILIVLAAVLVVIHVVIAGLAARQLVSERLDVSAT